MSPTAISERQRRTRHRGSEAGFTLAALIVLLTIMMVFVAYTVPPMWSKVIKRDRDRQTLFVMKQYARAIRTFQEKHGGTTPVSLDQLKEARSPRVMRGVTGELPDPLTGKVDWILVPPSALQGAPVAGSSANGGSGNPSEPNWNPSPNNPAYANGGNGTATAPAATPGGPNTSPKDYVGPFVGVRPNLEGPSYLVVKGSDKYEDWLYTTEDLKNEINAAILGIQQPGVGPVPMGGSGIEAGPPPPKKP
jgi:type II secretory pathway pseudopilin PulG